MHGINPHGKADVVSYYPIPHLGDRNHPQQHHSIIRCIFIMVIILRLTKLRFLLLPYQHIIMTPGPTLILQPKGCRTPLQCRTIGSGNTFGARFWTDGKREAPMLPDEPSLLKHPTEAVLFWRNECKEIGEIDFWSNEAADLEWNDLPEVAEPNELDYLSALGARSADLSLRKNTFACAYGGYATIRSVAKKPKLFQICIRRICNNYSLF